ncbi:ATP-binding protein [Streptomyces chromofuscus]|uniref:ATP-binding protein n=1 Tax=Streptomyces chromofuscus TaxID=42881 RepID=A0A7M2T908_STRCW|nr:ATP-binding protein [Streptomyces chromofuscus]QOV44734.1 ATP-binding protein [Streptomyces chromofuscus]GGT00721.1 ATP-binding protein [Streptomyces chromofuscus]
MCGNASYDHPGIEATLALPAEAPYVRMARHFGTALLDQWGLTLDERDTAIAVLGELAANAAEHGRSKMAIALALSEFSLRISVVDFGREPGHGGSAVRRAADESGRGMEIVRVLSDRMSVERQTDGYCIEAVLPCGRVSASASGLP